MLAEENRPWSASDEHLLSSRRCWLLLGYASEVPHSKVSISSPRPPPRFGWPNEHPPALSSARLSAPSLPPFYLPAPASATALRSRRYHPRHVIPARIPSDFGACAWHSAPSLCYYLLSSCLADDTTCLQAPPMTRVIFSLPCYDSGGRKFGSRARRVKPPQV